MLQLVGELTSFWLSSNLLRLAIVSRRARCKKYLLNKHKSRFKVFSLSRFLGKENVWLSSPLPLQLRCFLNILEVNSTVYCLFWNKLNDIQPIELSLVLHNFSVIKDELKKPLNHEGGVGRPKKRGFFYLFLIYLFLFLFLYFIFFSTNDVNCNMSLSSLKYNPVS